MLENLLIHEMQGCGRGYDVVMLALHGFDACGLDISRSAVAVARAYAATEMERPTPYNFNAECDTRDTSGAVSFIEGDFFETDWKASIPSLADGKFDLIYDYTVITSC